MHATLKAPPYAQDSPNAEAVATLLIAYLANDAEYDPDKVAVAVLAQFPSGPNTTTFEFWETSLRYFWAIVYDLAKQISCEDVRQPKLISLLVAIREQPPPANIPPEFYDWHGDRFWTDLPRWRSVWNDFEIDAPLRPPMEDRDAMEPGSMGPRQGPWLGHKRHSRDDWTNLNAFQARFYTAVPTLRFGDRIGLHAQLEALEEDYRDATALEELLPAASCWIVYAGAALKRGGVTVVARILPHAEDHIRRLPYSRGALYNGTPCFNDEHWAFWKRRYTTLLDREGLSLGTRDLVSRALHKLEILGY